MFEALILAAALMQGPAVSPLCRTAGACRHVENVVLRRSGADSVEVEVDRELPWIDANGVLGLYNGEVAVIRLSGGEALRPELVATARAAATHALKDGEIRVRLVQGGDFENRLIVESRLDKPVHFNIIETVITDLADVASEQVAPAACTVAARAVQPQTLSKLGTRVGLTGFKLTDRDDCYTELQRR